MSQADENHLPTEPPPGAPTTPPPLLQPNLNPPPGYLGSAGPQPYPYPSPVPAVHVTMYAPPVAAKKPRARSLAGCAVRPAWACSTRPCLEPSSCSASTCCCS